MKDEFEIVTGFPSTTGGVLTKEVGAITGELILTTRTSHDAAGEAALVWAYVSYVSPPVLYTVVGSPVPLEGEEEGSLRTHEEVHWEIIERLQTPTGDGWLNEPPADLRR